MLNNSISVSVSASRSSFVIRSNDGYWISAVAASYDGLELVTATDSDGVIFEFGPDAGAVQRAYKRALSYARDH